MGRPPWRLYHGDHQGNHDPDQQAQGNAVFQAIREGIAAEAYDDDVGPAGGGCGEGGVGGMIKGFGVHTRFVGRRPAAS